MATSGGPNIVTDGLVFGYDTGYPQIKSNSDSYKFNKGEPTINLSPVSNEKTGGNEYLPYCSIVDILDTYGTGSGVQFYVSFEAKAPVPGTVLMYTSDTAARKYSWTGVNFSVTTEFQKFQLPISNVTIYNDQYSDNRLSFYGGYGTGKIPTVKNVQIERKTHSTPFVSGSRSVSGSLIDLTGQRDIDLSNVSFDSNAQMVFDGTDDFCTIPDSTVFDFGTGDFTLEAVIKGTGTDSYRNIFYHYYDPGVTFITNITTGVMRVWIDLKVMNGNTNILDGKYHHVVVVREGDRLTFYVDSQQDATSTGWGSKSATNLDKGASLGRYIDGSSNYPWNGYIPIFKAYNKALSAEEIQENYNATKSRFNL